MTSGRHPSHQRRPNSERSSLPLSHSTVPPRPASTGASDCEENPISLPDARGQDYPHPRRRWRINRDGPQLPPDHQRRDESHPCDHSEIRTSPGRDTPPPRGYETASQDICGSSTTESKPDSTGPRIPNDHTALPRGKKPELGSAEIEKDPTLRARPLFCRATGPRRKSAGSSEEIEENRAEAPYS